MATQVRAFSVEGVLKFNINEWKEVDKDSAEKSVRDFLLRDVADNGGMKTEIVHLNLKEVQEPHFDPDTIDWEE